jgi:uncharacterized OsmC-like protein
MNATMLAETEAKFRSDPPTAKSSPTVTASLVNGRARLSAGPFNWDADLPAALGGENVAPSPTAYLLGALAGCAVAFLHDMLAPAFDVQVDDVTAVASASSDARGLLGLDGVAPDLADLALDIKVSTSSPKDRIHAMLAAWRKRCPIYLALLKPQSIALTTAGAVQVQNPQFHAIPAGAVGVITRPRAVRSWRIDMSSSRWSGRPRSPITTRPTIPGPGDINSATTPCLPLGPSYISNRPRHPLALFGGFDRDSLVRQRKNWTPIGGRDGDETARM